MGLFDRNHYDRDFGMRADASGQNRGWTDRAGESLRRGWNRVENGARDTFDRGGYDRTYRSQGGMGTGWGASQNASWSGDSYRAGGMGYDNTYRAGGFGGGASYGNHGEGLGDRMRHGWHRLTEGARDAFDRNDQHDLGYRGSPNGGINGGLSRDNLNRGGWGGGLDRSNASFSGYDRDFGNHGTGFGAMDRGYDRDLGGRGNWMDRDRGGYDRGFKSREQTDAGDPFGDRTSHTPIRMMRGGFRGGNMGGGMSGGSMGIDYDRPYKQGIGDEPYYEAGDFNRGGMSGGAAGYDRGWRNNRGESWF